MRPRMTEPVFALSWGYRLDTPMEETTRARACELSFYAFENPKKPEHFGQGRTTPTLDSSFTGSCHKPPKQNFPCPRPGNKFPIVSCLGLRDGHELYRVMTVMQGLTQESKCHLRDTVRLGEHRNARLEKNLVLRKVSTFLRNVSVFDLAARRAQVFDCHRKVIDRGR